MPRFRYPLGPTDRLGVWLPLEYGERVVEQEFRQCHLYDDDVARQQAIVDALWEAGWSTRTLEWDAEVGSSLHYGPCPDVATDPDDGTTWYRGLLTARPRSRFETNVAGRIPRRLLPRREHALVARPVP